MKNLFLLTFLLVTLTSCGQGVPQLSHSGICDGYVDSADSDYVVPWPIGKTYSISQGNCGAASHIGSQRYAYDVDMPIGSQIVAIKSGTVIEIEESFEDSNGCPDANFIVIRHTDGTVANYHHLTKNGAQVGVGDLVTQGANIGLSGNTGCSAGAHLHFAVFTDEDQKETIPITFSNAGSNNRGLIDGKSYTAR